MTSEIQHLSDDEGKNRIINLLEEEENEESKESSEPSLKNEKETYINSKKREPEGKPDDENHEMKGRKEFGMWEDLKGMMRCRIPRVNCKTRYEEPSDLFADV